MRQLAFQCIYGGFDGLLAFNRLTQMVYGEDCPIKFSCPFSSMHYENDWQKNYFHAPSYKQIVFHLYLWLTSESCQQKRDCY